ncbi:MAG: hypothetical protein IPI73_16970 [Betaproteobacteria bacterium]|nr:hypothetical protein [Betaproteobacteria bacterium]
MIANPLCKVPSSVLLGFLFAAGVQAAQTDISTVPLETYSAPSSTDVKPNVLFVLDDSGSMDWDFMPDWACVDNISIQNLQLLVQFHLAVGVIGRRRTPVPQRGVQRPLLQSGDQLQAADSRQQCRRHRYDHLPEPDRLDRGNGRR